MSASQQHITDSNVESTHLFPIVIALIHHIVAVDTEHLNLWLDMYINVTFIHIRLCFWPFKPLTDLDLVVASLVCVLLGGGGA